MIELTYFELTYFVMLSNAFRIKAYMVKHKSKRESYKSSDEIAIIG